ncbi:hypothetical protein Taro_029085 [Colocasia esculenta]|uniref:Cytochrome P450 71A1 n=1 Tax=Colocasia esculenta TaxID=4460 RepID=A0A843VQ24_COLES|nr:hypothetical protein [Colocasia esculenta]
MAQPTELRRWLLQEGSSLQLLCLAFLLPLLLFVVITTCARGDPKKKQPPSPRKLPIIGNLHQLGSLPHRSLRSLSQKHGPLMLLRLGQVPTLVVSSAEAAREAMTTRDLVFATRPPSKAVDVLSYGSKNVTFAPYGEHWRQAKKAAIVHLLGPKKVQSFRGVRAQEVAAMVEGIAWAAASSPTGVVVDLREAFHKFAHALISRVVLGRCSAGDGRNKAFREVIEEAKSAAAGLRFVEAFPSLAWLGTLLRADSKLRKVFKKWDSLLSQVVEEHERRGPEGDEVAAEGDFVDALLSIHRDPAMGFPLSMDHVKGIFVDLVAAGTSTSYTLLDWAMAELVRNPGEMERAQREIREIVIGGKPMATEDDVAQMSYLRAVIKEVLRLHPPVPLLLPRESMEDTQLQGYHVPRKTRLLVNAWAIARDPASWEAPEVFRPDRFLGCQTDFRGSDFEFIPFGAGRRICPGISFFAISGIELALANLLYRFDWALPGAVVVEDFDMDEAPGNTVRRKSGLRLVAIPYNPKLPKCQLIRDIRTPVGCEKNFSGTLVSLT